MSITFNLSKKLINKLINKILSYALQKIKKRLKKLKKAQIDSVNHSLKLYSKFFFITIKLFYVYMLKTRMKTSKEKLLFDNCNNSMINAMKRAFVRIDKLIFNYRKINDYEET